MAGIKFNALGTVWEIIIQADNFPDRLQDEIIREVNNFEKRFSRFLMSSEVNLFRHRSAGTYRISSELSSLLKFAQELRQLTGGLFDPAVGGLLELAGYDPEYSFKSKKELDGWIKPFWKVEKNNLTIGGPVIFDLGSFGKGACIDLVSELIKKHNLKYYLVDGGRDILAGRKKDGKGWNIALEWPGKVGFAIGEVGLENKALAVSDIYKRRWGGWHHLLNPQSRVPHNDILGCAVVAENCLTADGLTTAISLVDKDKRIELCSKFNAEYYLLNYNNMVETSGKWPGIFFTT